MGALEIDLFKRLKSQSREAFETYLATESGARAFCLSLVAETASAYVTLAADMRLAELAGQADADTEHALRLTATPGPKPRAQRETCR